MPAGISGSGASVTFNPSGLTPTSGVVRAYSTVLTNCADECTVHIVKVDIVQTELFVSQNSTNVTLNLTADSYAGAGGTFQWAVSNTSLTGSGTNFSFNPSSLAATSYTVNAWSSLLASNKDGCAVTVIKIDIAPVTVVVGAGTTNVAFGMSADSYGRVTWSLAPSLGTEGAKLGATSDTNAFVDAGTICTSYFVKAVATDLPICQDMAQLAVITNYQIVADSRFVVLSNTVSASAWGVDAGGQPVRLVSAWTISAGTDKVVFVTSTTGDTVSVKGIAASAAEEDVTIHASPTNAPSVSDEEKVTVFKLEMITPAGDPVGAPVDSGDGQNEFTFSSASTGVLTMAITAQVTPSGIATQVKDRVYFTVDSIGGSVLAWNTNTPAGKPAAGGGGLVATATFTGLPANNSDFGSKKAAMYLDGLKIAETNYEVFFPKNANNHPGIGGGTTPNWFYYWSQTPANLSATTMIYTNGMRSYYDYFNGRTIVIEDDAALSQIAAWGTPQGIDCFAWTTAHENKHHVQISGFWPTNWIASQDIDSDWLPNNQETNYMPGRAYSPSNAATFPDTFGYGQDPIPDVEDINMRSQVSPYNLDVLWVNGAANTNDWSNVGKNSASTY